MIAGTIWQQLKLTLEENSTLKGYIEYVFNGRRFNIEPDSLPCIMLEPVGNNEIIKEMNNVKEVALSIDLFAFSSVSHNDYTDTIIGDQNYHGILSIENDIRACLQASNTLGDLVIDTIIQETVFDQIDVDKYPVRGALIPLRIKYRQIDGV
jgi:hypothetical protein